MKIQKATRLNKTDYPDAPKWATKLFKVLNTQLERYVTLFNGNITHQENLRDEIAKIDLTHDTTLPVKLNVLKRNPIGVQFLGSNYFEYPIGFTWEMAEDSLTVNVKVKWDAPPDGEVRCTLLFIGS